VSLGFEKSRGYPPGKKLISGHCAEETTPPSLGEKFEKVFDI
jgi:hypothetical protein